MKIATLFLALAGAAALPAAARLSDEPPAAEPVPVLEEVLVSGEQPGPGLWKVLKPTGDGEHVLWILGSYGPLPKGITWRSRQVEAAIAQSQELLAPASVKADIGFFSKVALLPSLVGVRNNPGDARLEDVVPADLYARWLPLKARFLGNDDSVEKWRPIFAAGELYSAAIKRSGLELSNVVWPAIEKLARKGKVKVTTPKVAVKVDKPRAMVKDFKQSKLDDLECFARTLERLESDLELMRARANAWATGDLATLRELKHVDQAGACIAVVMNSELVQTRGYADVPARLADSWLAAAEDTLARNRSTFAVLSLTEILKPDGVLARLRARGYEVEEP